MVIKPGTESMICQELLKKIRVKDGSIPDDVDIMYVKQSKVATNTTFNNSNRQILSFVTNRAATNVGCDP